MINMGFIEFGDVNRDEVTPEIWLGHQWDQSVDQRDLQSHLQKKWNRSIATVGLL